MVNHKLDARAEILCRCGAKLIVKKRKKSPCPYCGYVPATRDANIKDADAR